MNEANEREIFKDVLFHSLLIILMPIMSFFLSKLYFFDAILGLESLQSNLYSSFVAVIILHIALGNFIYRAFFITTPDPVAQAKQD